MVVMMMMMMMMMMMTKTKIWDTKLKLRSLRSKHFQSSYCAKVRAKAKKKFFCSSPSFLDETSRGNAFYAG